LAEKAYNLGHRIYIHADSAAQAGGLDELLWTFRQGSFVPHAMYPGAAQDNSPVLLGWGESAYQVLATLRGPPDPNADPDNRDPNDSEATSTLLINLALEAPASFEQFDRVAEVVDQAPETLAASRRKFRYFREHGYEPHSHKL
jgi:DNA polymerase-3 subunit chi